MSVGYVQQATVEKLTMGLRRLYKSEVSHDTYPETGNLP